MVAEPPVARSILLEGLVQGVGFRPFVHGLARRHGLAGWVGNSTRGLEIEVEGPEDGVRRFLDSLERDRPDGAIVHGRAVRGIAPRGHPGFAIRSGAVPRPPGSAGPQGAEVVAAADVATCGPCLRETLDPGGRRFRYPFTSCATCGPRYSIAEGLPWDRARTTMAAFELCTDCRSEYEDPSDRRFHAETIACPACGPSLALWDARGRGLAEGERALDDAVDALGTGAIVAVQGLGGFHLMVRATDPPAVARLRERKRRGPRPFAVLFADLASVRERAGVGEGEARALGAPRAPIVILDREGSPGPGVEPLAPEVAPGSDWLGAMLPSTPLQHLLVGAAGAPLVATSGNGSGEPLVTDPGEALHRLGGIADRILVSNRRIARPLDDSVVRVVLGRPIVLRRARGYAPAPVDAPDAPPDGPAPSDGPDGAGRIALGGHLKSAFAARVGGRVVLGQHLGDLDHPRGGEAYRSELRRFRDLHGPRPARVVCDGHPGYRTSELARELDPAPVAVLHHVAHVWAAAAEARIRGTVLGVAWDGTGLGPEGELWGGELLRVDLDGGAGWERAAHLRSLRLPGGEAAIREPRRVAAAMLVELRGEEVLDRMDLAPIASLSRPLRSALPDLLRSGVRCPATTSAGRLFDGVSSILGLRQEIGFEGEAAIALEQCAARAGARAATYELALPAAGPGPAVLDWAPLLDGILEDLGRGVAREVIAAGFHRALVEGLVAVADRTGEERVVLGGGCFQNAILLSAAVRRLRERGHEPVWPRLVPPNDGGLAVGQLLAAERAGRE